MGTLLNRRRYMGGKSLPYDAEIEYLENTGSSYIDTGVYPTEQLSFEITLQRVLADGNDEVAFGSRYSNYNADFSLWTNTASSKGFAVHYPYNNNGSSGEDSGWKYQGNITRSFHTVKVTPQNYSVDETVCYTFQNQNRPAFTSIFSLVFFAFRDGSQINRYFIGKISKVKIWLSNTLVRDYIPVRVGQVGYMYDKISGQLFGNAGSGAFTLGPDIVTHYDAEIEYLRSDGYAYIDTGYNGNELIELTITIARFEETTSTMLCFWGWWMDGGNVPCFQLITQNNKIVAPTDRNSFSLSGISASTVWEQDVFYTFTATQTQTSTSDRTAYLFARNLGAVSLVNPHIQIRQATIKRGGVLVRDYIAVRKGTTGYLYDKVSGQLFGNSGTGSFVLGQDIVPIEYLESSGTQYLDTGITPDENTGVYADVVCSDDTDVYFVGLRNDSGDTRWGVGHAAGGFYYCYGIYGSNPRLSGRTAEVYLNYLNDGYYIATNGTTTQQAALPSLSFTPIFNIFLFGNYNINSIKTWKGKVYAFKISQGSTIIMDLIPVRVGTTGYMYDKISGQLFGNAGSGDFILGNDKT